MREHGCSTSAAPGGPAAAAGPRRSAPSSGETFATVAVADPADVDAAVRRPRAACPAWAAAVAVRPGGLVRAGRRRRSVGRARGPGPGAHPGPGQAAGGRGLRRGRRAGRVLQDGRRGRQAAGGRAPAVGVGRAAGCSSARVPLGVVGVVSPWNWPYTMGAEVFAPALAAGNTVVWVPAPTTTACCALLAEVIAARGRPPAGVFNFVPGPGPVVGRRAGRPSRRGRRWASSGRSRPARGRGRGRPARPSCSNWAATGPWWYWTTPTWHWPPMPRWRPRTCAPARAAPRASGSWCTRRCGPSSPSGWWRRPRTGSGSATRSTRGPPWAR